MLRLRYRIATPFAPYPENRLPQMPCDRQSRRGQYLCNPLADRDHVAACAQIFKIIAPLRHHLFAFRGEVVKLILSADSGDRMGKLLVDPPLIESLLNGRPMSSGKEF